MHIDGWAFKENEEKLRNKRYEQYKQLNRDYIEIESAKIGYMQNTYYGKIKNKELTPLDILLICDDGNTCFGGEVSVDSDKSKFTAVVYTD